jgi:hypothetical protein
MDRRQVRPKKKKSPQGQENMDSNVRKTPRSRAYALGEYELHEGNIILTNLRKAEEALDRAAETLKKKKENAKKFDLWWAQMQREDMIDDMPSIPKLRNKTKSVPKSIKKSKTRKHKTI